MEIYKIHYTKAVSRRRLLAEAAKLSQVRECSRVVLAYIDLIDEFQTFCRSSLLLARLNECFPYRNNNIELD